MVAAAAARAASAYIDLDRSQAILANALSVTAGASGQSAASLQKLTESMARFGVSSVADIRAAESELLRFRSVSGSAFGDTLKLAQDLSATGFTNLSGAVSAFGKALSDPVKGLDGLRDAGLRYSPIQEKLILDLYKQGRLQSAQSEILKIAAQQLRGATAMAADTATAAYGRFTNAITLGIERMGQNIAEAVRLKAILDGISAAAVKGMSNVDKERQTFVSALEMAQAGQMPGMKGDLITGTLAMGMRRIGTVQPPFNAVDWSGFVAQLNEARDRIEAVNVALAKEQREAGLTEVALRILHEQQRAGVTAHSEAGRAISGYVSSVMAILHTKQATEQIRMQAASAEIEARTLGMSAGAAAAYRLEQEALAQARIRGIALSQNQVAAIHKEAEAYRKAAEAANALRLTNDVAFERQLIGLSEINQQIAQRLRAAYGDTGWQAQMDGFLAQQMRLNDYLRQTSDLGRDALKGFVSDLMTGKSASEALGSALNKISSKLMDMAINGLWEAAFPKAAGGLLGFLGIGGGLGAPLNLGNFGGTGGLLGPMYHSGGIVGSSGMPTRLVHPGHFDDAQRFATGGIAGLGPDEIGIIAHRNEEIVRADDPRHRWNGGVGESKNSVTLNFAPTIDARGADAEAVARIEYSLEKMRREFATNVIKVVEHARSHRAMKF